MDYFEIEKPDGTTERKDGSVVLDQIIVSEFDGVTFSALDASDAAVFSMPLDQLKNVRRGLMSRVSRCSFNEQKIRRFVVGRLGSGKPGGLTSGCSLSEKAALYLAKELSK